MRKKRSDRIKQRVASAGSDQVKDDIRIGVKLKHARLTIGLPLHRVAATVGCSESFLSKVENDKVRPSLAMLHKLVRALNINVSSLFAPYESDGPVAVMRHGARPIIKVDPEWQGPGIELERLIGRPDRVLLQASVHHVQPGASTEGMLEHDGEELGYVLEGEIELSVDGKIYNVQKGDSFFFLSSLPHGYRNPGKEPARVLWVNSPPSF